MIRILKDGAWFATAPDVRSADRLVYAYRNTYMTHSTFTYENESYVQIGWRWKYREGSPPGHTHSHVYETPGPTDSAIAAAQNSCFAPATVEPVYVRSLR